MRPSGSAIAAQTATSADATAFIAGRFPVLPDLDGWLELCTCSTQPSRMTTETGMSRSTIFPFRPANHLPEVPGGAICVYDRFRFAEMTDLNARAVRSSLLGAVTMAVLLFIPVGTFAYWQAWLFMAVFVGASAAITAYLAINDPKLLERRMNVGPRAEKEPTQRVLMFFAMMGFVALLVFPAFDHRFGWSSVPAYVCVAGNALVALGFLLVFMVLKANPYGGSTIQVVEGQEVVSTGPYALVRHPMYAGAIPLLVGVPLALGSWWGLLVLLVVVPTLVWRLLDEEDFLRRNLPGYASYCQEVRYRLIPFVW